MKNKSRGIQAEFAEEFARSWEATAARLRTIGIEEGAEARGRDGALYRITQIEPRVHNFGNPGAAITVSGVKFRADGTWGTHSHWIGDAADLEEKGRRTK